MHSVKGIKAHLFERTLTFTFASFFVGMLRSDRTLSEELFASGIIRILCCTATLAWGVNLPAHTVIIRGTGVYNAEKGKIVQLGILDVQQIFGRAGRPQFDKSGEAMWVPFLLHMRLCVQRLLLTISLLYFYL